MLTLWWQTLPMMYHIPQETLSAFPADLQLRPFLQALDRQAFPYHFLMGTLNQF
jgi:hypothetical protein